jgi:hypothetical protein
LGEEGTVITIAEGAIATLIIPPAAAADAAEKAVSHNAGGEVAEATVAAVAGVIGQLATGEGQSGREVRRLVEIQAVSVAATDSKGSELWQGGQGSDSFALRSGVVCRRREIDLFSFFLLWRVSRGGGRARHGRGSRSNVSSYESCRW